MHVPVKREVLSQSMEPLLGLLSLEESAAVRVALGHFFFVFIHPYMDGNGRIGRFLMDIMPASGGCPWTVIPVEAIADYMQALEEASVRQNIRPFAQFDATLVYKQMEGSGAITPRPGKTKNSPF
ncbi:Fic family protein [Pelagicoccus sp. SDUM812005]|uniref:Fic family protein n=1 Tax=Pelagicoccus sp. SDUM812005 TaxID=3041257 RepID=UPI0031BAFBED